MTRISPTHAKPHVLQLFPLFFTQGATSTRPIFFITDWDHVLVATDERHGFSFDQAALFLPIDVEMAFLNYLEDLVFVSQVK